MLHFQKSIKIAKLFRYLVLVEFSVGVLCLAIYWISKLF